MAVTSFTQSGIQQGNSIDSQYINKVKILPDGSLQVTKTNLLPKNVVKPLPKQTEVNLNSNQIAGTTSTESVAGSTSLSSSASLNSQGINSNNVIGPPPTSITE